jgi:hypothetical protein
MSRSRRRKKPKELIIRVYNVGFGDCFLLTFRYSARMSRHVLIDFGSSAKPAGAKRDHFKRVARHIKETCGGKLHVVVATHRHSDHLSGFALGRSSTSPGRVIRDCEPDYVIQPWTEDPKVPEDAKAPPDQSDRLRGFVSSLRKMQEVAAVASAEVKWMRAHRMAVGEDVATDLTVYGESGIRNRSAVRNLRTMAKRGERGQLYVHYGKRLPLGRVLPGVKIRILGPPTLDQSEAIESQRTKDANEYWHLQNQAVQFAAASGARLFPRAPAFAEGRHPVEARPFVGQLQSIRGEQLLSIVRTLDNVLNNTSVILLFEIGRQKILFSGDAQIENWSYALEDASDSASNRRLLRNVTVYKVGHHGSLNATPRESLWDRFAKKSSRSGDKGRLQTLLSTMEGKHGSERKKTEVPRKKLVSALKRYSKLTNTQDMEPNEKPGPISIAL